MERKRNTPFTILLADDDSDDRFLFREAVMEVGNIVLITVNDGVELMNKLVNMVNHPPDIILLDLNMPFKNGHECLREIKSNDRYRDIPVIIYSTSANKSQVEQTYQEGANMYIPKPDSYFKLRSLVASICAMEMNRFHPQPSLDKFVLNYQ